MNGESFVKTPPPPEAITNYNQPWSHESMAQLQDYRRLHPAADEMVRNILAAELAPAPEHRVILELGAGDGRGNRVLGRLPANTTLVETDSSRDLLSAPRPNPSHTLCATCPDPHRMPAQYADMLLALNFFDTLTEAELAEALPEARRLLKPGGRLYMVMDVPPCLSTEIMNCARRGEMVFPYYSQEQNGRLAPEGLFYISAGDFDALRYAWPQDRELAGMRRYGQWLSDYAENPIKALAHWQADLAEYLPIFHEMAAKENFILRQEPSFVEMQLRNLDQKAGDAGFGEVTTGQESVRERSGLITTVSWITARQPFPAQCE